MTHESWQQEQFSRAYVAAVAAVAGYAVNPIAVDIDGIDLTISSRGGGGVVRSPKLDVQIKSETSGKPGKLPWKYPLKVKNYDDLRPEDVSTPRILVVVAMPKDASDWLRQTPSELCLRHCAYWTSLRGEPATKNTATVTVSLPKNQKFSPQALGTIMMRIGQGQLP